MNSISSEPHVSELRICEITDIPGIPFSTSDDQKNVYNHLVTAGTDAEVIFLDLH